MVAAAVSPSADRVAVARGKSMRPQGAGAAGGPQAPADSDSGAHKPVSACRNVPIQSVHTYKPRVIRQALAAGVK